MNKTKTITRFLCRENKRRSRLLRLNEATIIFGLTLVLPGCFGDGLNPSSNSVTTPTTSTSPTTTPTTSTETGNGSAPTATLGTPSQLLLNSAATSTITLTYSGATTLTGALTAGGGGTTITTLSGSPSCSVSVSGISTSGATITLQNCTGNGTLSIHVNANTATNSSNLASAVSNESAIITVDNTAPTFSSSSPANSSIINSIPSSITVNFSKAINAISSNFSLSTGTCTSNPTISSISGSGTSSITINLSGGSCSGGQHVVLTSNLSTISDLAGNAGSGTMTVTLQFPSTYKIFVTSSSHNGNFGTISAADSFCNSDANKPAGGATYKAMIVDGTNRRACSTANCSGGASENIDWVLHANSIYHRADGTTVIGTTNAGGIFTTTFTNAIEASANYPLTGLNTDWTVAPDTGTSGTCSGWTSSSNLVTYTNGKTSDTTPANAIHWGHTACNLSLPVICVEQ